MIKLSFCLHRLPNLSREAFQQYWFDVHAPLVRSVAGVLNIRRYVQSHSLSDPALGFGAQARGSAGLEYDGVAELWWDDLESRMAPGASEEGRAAGLLLLEDERRFIDLPRSPIFFVTERQVI